MDPASIVGIVGAVVGLVTSITTLSFRAHEICKDFTEARRDIETVTREIYNLSNVVKHFNGNADLLGLPPQLQASTKDVVGDCKQQVDEMTAYLDKASRRRARGVMWALTGKRECMQFCRSMEAHKSTLNPSLNVAQMNTVGDLADKFDIVLDEVSQLRRSLLPTDRYLTLRRFLAETESTCDSMSSARQSMSRMTSIRSTPRASNESFRPNPSRRPRFVRIEDDQHEQVAHTASSIQASTQSLVLRSPRSTRRPEREVASRVELEGASVPSNMSLDTPVEYRDGANTVTFTEPSPALPDYNSIVSARSSQETPPDYSSIVSARSSLETIRNQTRNSGGTPEVPVQDENHFQSGDNKSELESHTTSESSNDDDDEFDEKASLIDEKASLIDEKAFSIDEKAYQFDDEKAHLDLNGIASLLSEKTWEHSDYATGNSETTVESTPEPSSEIEEDPVSSKTTVQDRSSLIGTSPSLLGSAFNYLASFF